MQRPKLSLKVAFATVTVSLFPLFSSAADTCFAGSKASPQPALQTVAGISYCTAALQNYAAACPNGGICLNSFRRAMTDAGAYFLQAGAGAMAGFQLTLPVGLLDFRGDTSTIGNSTIIPLPLASAASATPPSASARLLIAGAGMDEQAGGTELLTRHTQLLLSGTNISHVTVTGIHFATDYAAVGQGFLVSATKVNQVVNGRTYLTPALTIQMQSFPSAGFYNLAAGFDVGGVFNEGRDLGQFLRSYDNMWNPGTSTYSPVVDANPDNYQISFHDICNDSLAKSCVSTTRSLTSTTLTFLLGSKTGRMLTPYESAAYGWFQGLAASGQNQFICMKEAGANAGFSHITDTVAGGDIVFDHLTWTEAAHAQFQGVSGVTITNSVVQREPAAALGDGTFQSPCLSTDTGAMQIHGPTFGNVVANYTAEATGDDSLAIQGDTGGTGGNAASTVSASFIENSFDRAILITSVAGDKTPYAATINVPPYVGPGYGGAPYAQSTSCSLNPGDNCIPEAFVPCPYGTSTQHGLSVYCPVKVQPAG
jgi:hypothetical protein